MALDLRLQQKMSQQLVMTPQLQQAIKLLQLNHMELAETLLEEMAQNPLLEEGDRSDVSDDNFDTSVKASGDGAEGGDGASDTTASSEAQELVADMNNVLGDVSTPEPSEKEVQKDVDWDSYGDSYSYALPTGSAARGDDERPSYEATLSRPESLQDDLARQARMLGLSAAELEIALRLIEDLLPSGYLPEDAAETAAQDLDVDIEQVENVLAMMRGMEPIGVFSRSLEECLLTQCEYHFPEETLLPVLLERFMPELERHSYAKIATALEIDINEIGRALKLMEKLEPKPGAAFSEPDAQYVSPDIYVKRVGEKWVITLNEDGLPKLRISTLYQNALQDSKGKTKAYIQDQLRNASWLIKSIHMRQRTIYRVMESILKFQSDFFDKGREHLKPLVLRDIAEDIEMHESTISRVTTNKYVHCPHGLFELKYFFNSSIARTGQESIASESVREHIRKLIESEDPKKPFSDQKLVQLLTDQGIEIARRTVAKYREMLGIPSSSKRKQVFTK